VIQQNTQNKYHNTMSLKLLTPKHYYNEFKQLLKFVITPINTTNHALTISQKIKGAWTMFVVKFILAIIIGVSIGVFYDAENLTRSNMAERFSPIALLFVTVLILPLLEEVAFRLSLKFKPIFLALSLGILTYYFVSKGVYHTKLSDVYDHFIERCFISLGTLCVTYALFSITKIKNWLELFWNNNFKWIFYSLCFAFAWIHIFNYELSLEHLLLMPIITMDKLVSALCYGYTRVTYGFVYSLAIHMLNNSIGFMVIMISSAN